jgi:hypothetical protein
MRHPISKHSEPSHIQQLGPSYIRRETKYACYVQVLTRTVSVPTVRLRTHICDVQDTVVCAGN